MKNIIYILFIAIAFQSCSQFQKTLRSDDIAAKYKLGEQLFEAEKYKKANRLFEQIITQYRGKPQAEKLTYMQAMCEYKLRYFYKASYLFDKFTDIYPNSEKAEEAYFLSAKGYYYNSPVYSKDQKETIEAIEKLQLFINSYPNSEFLAEANKIYKELDFKLEKKAFEIAKQYDQIKDYKASLKSFNNFLFDFPGTSLREEALFYRFDAAFNLADLSVERKKKERIGDAIGYFNKLKKSFPNSEFMDEALEMKNKLESELSTLSTNL